jgi:hypothetical protein
MEGTLVTSDMDEFGEWIAYFDAAHLCPSIITENESHAEIYEHHDSV